MALQRKTDPIPLGRYWMIIQDTPEGNIADFDEWLQGSKSVNVESSSLDDTGQFIVFNVTGPGAFLESKQFGFPNIAPASIETREDAIQAETPDVPGVADFLQGVKTAGKIAVIGLIGILLYKGLR